MFGMHDFFTKLSFKIQEKLFKIMKNKKKLIKITQQQRKWQKFELFQETSQIIHTIQTPVGNLGHHLISMETNCKKFKIKDY